MQEVHEIVESVCRRTGWACTVLSIDDEKWLYVTLRVEKTTYTILGSTTVGGELAISVADDGKVEIHSPRFTPGYLPSLCNAMRAEVRQLPWVPDEREPSSDEQTGSLRRLEQLLRRFHQVAKQLERRHAGRSTLVIKDEYDVQDLLHALLKTVFDDVRPEDPTPSRAGASSRVDFVLKAERIVIEVKKASHKLGDKQLGEQLVVDIERYQSHPDCDTLMCFVYDPDSCLSNPKGLENDLSRRHGNLQVSVDPILARNLPTGL